MTNVAIVHRPAESRFEAMSGEDVVGHLDYTLLGGTVDMHHTWVEPEMRGHGVAGELVGEALREVGVQKLHVRPSCPYVADYIAQHPEHQALLEPSLTEEDRGA